MSAPLTERFAFVSPDWLYAICYSPTGLIDLKHQPDGKWLASRRNCNEFRILSDKVAVKMLNQALEQGLAVGAVHCETGDVLTFQLKAAPAKTVTPKQKV